VFEAERCNSLDWKGRTMSLWHLFTGQAELATVSVKHTQEDVDSLMHVPGKCQLIIFWLFRHSCTFEVFVHDTVR
jgi:hypothetical protein